ncbi:MAG: ParA family protein [Calditrichaeota bacterium]|nr:MAG: ParA family protein [Calditrichota bacterium]
MSKIIAIANPKGGVGKTTTTINLAASLAIAEKRVLIIDMDPAGSVSYGVGLAPENIRAGTFEIFSGTVNLLETIHPLDYLNIDVIPCNVFSSEQEIRLSEMAKNRIRLKRQLMSFLNTGKISYDYILIDTPPSLNDLTVGALLASDSVLIPLQCGYFALKALQRLMQMIERVRKSVNTELSVEGVLLTFYEKGTRTSMRSVQQAMELFGDLVLRTRIPKNVTLGYAAYEKKPVALVDISASGSRAYLSLAEELLSKTKPALPRYYQFEKMVDEPVIV